MKEILRSDDGGIQSLKLESEKYGEYVMHVSEETAWIDSGKKSASDANTLTEGEAVYVFHSVAATASLPPQSAAFAIVQNIPQDARCAQHLIVDNIETANGKTTITADNGNAVFTVNEKTTYAPYLTRNIVKLNDLKENSRIVVWFAAGTNGDTASAAHIMLLPDAQTELTRGELIAALYEAAGSPAVTGSCAYKDVAKDSAYYDAIVWATENGYISGYDNGSFGASDSLSREQLVTILWRYAGSPMLMDYPGLQNYTDAKEISAYARQAIAWAHQKDLLAQTSGKIQPKASVTAQDAVDMMDALGIGK